MIMADAEVITAVCKQLLAMQENSVTNMVKVLIDDVKADLRSLRNDINSLQVSAQFTSTQTEELKSRVELIERKYAKVEKGLTSHEKDIDFVVGKCDYLENQSRRNNIKVIGIDDSKGMNESWEESEKIIKDKIRDLLQIQDELVIERAHRVGNWPRKRDDGTEESRPIVAKFQSWKQKEMVLKKAREVKPQNIKFFADFSQLTLNRRRDQVPELIKAREAGHTAYFVADRLIVKPLNLHNKNRPGWSQRGARRNPTTNQNARENDAEGDPEISFS